MSKKIVCSMFATVTISVLMSGCLSAAPEVEVKSENVHNLKDYIVQKKPETGGTYKILAEQTNKTVVSIRDYNQGGSQLGKDSATMMMFLSDTSGYCKMIGGTEVYGMQAISQLKKLSQSPTDMVEIYKTLQKGNKDYEGFYKCQSSKDGFEVNYMIADIGFEDRPMVGGGGRLMDFSRYYMITHDKVQPIGYTNKQSYKQLEKSINNQTMDQIVENSTFRHTTIELSNSFCEHYDGQLYIANDLTDNKKMSFDDYIIAKSDNIRKDSSLPYLVAGSGIFDTIHPEYFWCETKNKNKEFQLTHKDGKVSISKGDINDYIKANKINSSSVTSLKDIDTQQVYVDEKLLSEEKALANMTFQSKQDMTKTTEMDRYSTSYNGENINGCSLVTVTKNEGKRDIAKHNYKKCGNDEAKYIGLSPSSDMFHLGTVNLNNLRQNCEAQGSAIAILDNDGLVAKCTQNKNMKGVKMIILKDDKLLSIRAY